MARPSKKKKQAASASASASSPTPVKGKDYKNMTLDELAELDDAHDDISDEEIDSHKAFNSEDERKYGKYFLGGAKNIASKNLSLSIPLKDGTARALEIGEDSKVTLSSICLDVEECDFDKVKVMYRCDKSDEFACLCNYLSSSKGGAGLMPSTPVNLEVLGPCKVEFKANVAPTSLLGSINIFGVVVPSDNLSGDVPYKYEDAFMSDDEEEVTSENEIVAEIESGSPDKKSKEVDTKSNGSASKASKKRKLAVEEKSEEEPPSKQKATESTPSTKQENGDANKEAPSATKMTKKQRKKLAQEKDKQLQETLAAARDEEANTEEDATNKEEDEAGSSKKKTKKKKKKKEDNSLSRPTSMTRERRIKGGLIISDMLLGAGPLVKPGKRISLHYSGTLRSSGKVFDKNHSKQHPLVFRQGTGEVIRGLERGLEGMKVGGERVITIPSKLGYGQKGSGLEVPPDSDLVFEVKVLKVG